YSAPATTVTLSLAPPSLQDRVVMVKLTNWGEGIRADELPHIFDRFNRGHGATQNAIPGTGAGLALVRGLVKKMGAKIAVTSQPGGDRLWQTSFTLEFKLHSKSTQVA
ncbi:MAG TPA: sensor histidine kinase, partial [Leptolyngbyaceae cyanobacterium M65_K2018_010]|nr:sensor histidine kinase [Leptolyngbyaceae cyanobacterium M65_K2018_010]